MKATKKYKKVVYEEETNSEPEVEESQYTPRINLLKKKKNQMSKNNKYLNKKIKYSIT